MEIAISALLAGAGLALLCVGGGRLVGGGVSVARRLGMSPLVIGMTIVAYGTSTPELAASIAAGPEHGAIVIGNVVGSNIANIGMVIGIASIMAPLAIGARALRREVPLMFGFAVLLVALSADGELSRIDGVLLLGALVAFAVHTCTSARRAGSAPADQGRAQVSVPRSVANIAVGIVALYVGATLTIDNAVVIASSLGLSEKVIGITVVAIGTSLPELITSVIAIRRGQPDIGVGSIIGSNICNILLITGVASAAFTIGVDGDIFVDYAIMIAFGAFLLVAARTGKIGRGPGAGAVAAYAVYLATLAFR
ncbi:MAG: calcium/sodium antiporter [Thaumarchaeota archaeon]|nr:calcium/sodium antiporter [Nitrososphaerota archaeon]RNJ72305.1 MAG: sodium:calcium antiporter [Thaumarchaeota archaeon S15]RNJ73538.1 MAG: sodium:calcium antiporter [Thaumarchaeota archaeon S14]RNJ73738.1 MAG: sodium:calcium antiporter [Thaumarchaeota archaeon S13]MDD9826342.1 calcium/sodium antiporter [Nitrososphaerota archaeon]